MMDATTQIAQLQEFLGTHFQAELLEHVRKGKQSLNVDFDLLSKFDPELAEMLLEEPENFLKACEVSVEQLEGVKGFQLRFKNLPQSQELPIRDLRASHLAKYMQIRGIVRQKSDVRPQMTSARFECPSCGNIISVLQLESKFREPTRCGCGRKGKFRLLSKELVDAQKIVLEEAADELDGGEQPKRLNIFLRKDLVAPMSDKKSNPGAKVVVTGFLKEVPLVIDGVQSTRYDLMLETGYVEPVEEDYSQINISQEEREKIRELAKDPEIYQKLIDSLAPSIYGHERIKEALILQMLGGVKKSRTDGVVTRGDMHVLLVGDPGSGKCVKGDTRIQLADGSIKPIEEIFESTEKKLIENDCYSPIQELRLPVLDLDGRIHISKATKLWRRKANSLLKITTASGNVLHVTKEHPLFTTWNGFITSVPADMLEENAIIATPRRIRIDSKPQQLSSSKFLDEEMSKLLGMIVGDGSTTQKNVIDFTNSDPKILSWYEQSFENNFGTKPITMEKAGTSALRKFCFSKAIYSFIKSNFPEIVGSSNTKNLPELVLKSSNKVLAGFISGLIDTDGHINPKLREIEYVTKSKTLAYDLKTALLRFQVVARVKPIWKAASNTKLKKKNLYYRLYVRGCDAQRLVNELRCVSDKLKSFPKKIGNTNVDVIPNLSNILKEVRRAHGLSQKDFGIARTTYMHYERGDRNPSKGKLKELVATYNDSDHPLAEILRQIAYADVFWDPISSIEEIESDEWVYDFEVEHVHNFIANSCIVHNSQLLKRATHVAPKSRYVSGKGASGAGLTATVVRDEFIRGWALEAGALVLANKGFCMIDELDKMSPEDRSAFHEALEQQTVTISKANIQATLRCETVVLAAANPKFGRFDPYELLAKQIELPSTLINRFDLIFPVRDLPGAEKDKRMADFILRLHQTGDVQEVPIETELLRKYVAYARSTIFPVLSEEAVSEIQKFYVDMRNAGNEGEGISAIPISARQLEALVRLAEASARTRLAKEVTKDDAKKAIDLIMHCLQQLGVDPETGKLDIDRLTTGVTASARNQVHTIKEIIRELAEVTGDKLVPEEDILAKAKEKGISEDKAEETLEKLNRLGDVFRPKPGFYSMMK